MATVASSVIGVLISHVGDNWTGTQDYFTCPTDTFSTFIFQFATGTSISGVTFSIHDPTTSQSLASFTANTLTGSVSAWVTWYLAPGQIVRASQSGSSTITWCAVVKEEGV